MENFPIPPELYHQTFKPLLHSIRMLEGRFDLIIHAILLLPVPIHVCFMLPPSADTRSGAENTDKVNKAPARWQSCLAYEHVLLILQNREALLASVFIPHFLLL